MEPKNPPPPRGPALDRLPGPSFLSLLYRLYPFYIFYIAYILSIFYIALLYLYIFYIFYIAYPKYLPNPPLFFGGRVTRVILSGRFLRRCAPHIWGKLHKFCCTQKSAQPKRSEISKRAPEKFRHGSSELSSGRCARLCCARCAVGSCCPCLLLCAKVSACSLFRLRVFLFVSFFSC